MDLDYLLTQFLFRPAILAGIVDVILVAILVAILVEIVVEIVVETLVVVVVIPLAVQVLDFDLLKFKIDKPNS